MLKKRLLPPLLALILCLPVSALGAEKNLPEVGQRIHGFQVTERGRLNLLEVPTVTLEHLKSGAKVYFIASDDEDRAFDITFRTPALDDRGTSHILEHSVLCGSDNYPSPNLFFAAANQTYNSFVNAMTGELATDYPVSSRSEAQLLKLMDFYLAGVFFPLLRSEERIFQREAWRYALATADAPMTRTGTVYNEMKGAVGISRAAADYGLRTLFPGTRLGNHSGGTPAAIPDLTWPDLVAYHQTYYVPSNALITLYGALDLAPILKFLDEQYLRAFDRVEPPEILPAGKPVENFTTARYAFPAEAGVDTAKGAYLDYGMAICNADSKARALLPVLADLLARASSPVARAVTEALPGASFSITASPRENQAFLMFRASGVDAGDGAAFQSAVDRGLSAVAQCGLGRDAVEAVVAQNQFALKSITESGPLGPNLAAMIAARWAADGTTDYLNDYETDLARMMARAGKGDFEGFVETYLIGNTQRALAITVPIPGLQEQQAAALAQRLAEQKNAMTDAEIAALVKATADFNTWSAQAADPALVASLKAVKVQDLPERLQDYPIADQTRDGVRLLSAQTANSGLGATALLLDLSGLSVEDLHWAALYGSLLGQLGTEDHSAVQVANLSARYLGNFYAGATSFRLEGDFKARPMLMAQFFGVPEDYHTGLTILRQILFQTDVSALDKIKPQVSRLRTEARRSLNENPEVAQMLRVKAGLAPEKYGLLNEMTGLAHAAFLEEAERQLSIDPNLVVQKLAAIRKTLTNRQNAIVLYAGDAAGVARHRTEISAVLKTLPQIPIIPADRVGLALPAQREGIVVDASVQYNMLAAPLENLGLKNSGKLDVLADIVTDRYLIPQMRHVLGAYGAAAHTSEDGVIFSTFRDPTVAGAYKVFAGAADALEALNLSQADIDGYSISAYAAHTRPVGTLTGGLNALMFHLRGISVADREGELRQIKSVTPADARDLSAALRALHKIGIKSTAGGAAALESNSVLFDSILYANGRKKDGAPR